MKIYESKVQGKTSFNFLETEQVCYRYIAPSKKGDLRLQMWQGLWFDVWDLIILLPSQIKNNVENLYKGESN